jgi:4-hydroxyphenylacetate 3-monooxygenase
MFFTGASFVIKGRAFRYFDWGAARGLVQGILDGYQLADELGCVGN